MVADDHLQIGKEWRCPVCQMRIVFKQGDKERIVLENAALLKVTDEGIMVNAMFEPPKLIKGGVVSAIDFLEGRVTVTQIAEGG